MYFLWQAQLILHAENQVNSINVLSNYDNKFSKSTQEILAHHNIMIEERSTTVNHDEYEAIAQSACMHACTSMVETWLDGLMLLREFVVILYMDK